MGESGEGELRIYIPMYKETLYTFCLTEQERSTADMIILGGFANIICMIIKKIAKISHTMRLTVGNCKFKAEKWSLFRSKGEKQNENV